MRRQKIAPPRLRSDGEGATRRLAGRRKTNSERRIPQLSSRDKKFYVPAGDHPLGFELYKHPLRGFVRIVEGCPVGLSTDEWDALEAYADQEAEAHFQDECDSIGKAMAQGVFS